MLSRPEHYLCARCGSQMKKRPVCVVRGAHSGGTDAASGGPNGGAGVEASGWVQSVAACRGSDLVVSTPCSAEYWGLVEYIKSRVSMRLSRCSR